jgi:hypothetical protein
MPGLSAGEPSSAQRLHAACASLSAPEACIDAAACARLGASLPASDAADALSRAPGVRFPINFGSLAAEVNFIALLSLLSFGSGWEAELRARPGGEGAHSLALRGLFSLHISGCAPPAAVCTRRDAARARVQFARKMRLRRARCQP